MKPYLLSAAVAVALAGGTWLSLRPDPKAQAQAAAPAEGAALVAITLPATLSAQADMGKRAFDAACLECHGENATGRAGFGPPLVHKIYEPSHHGDMAFFAAVQNGVRAHHWRFGDMPPQDGLTRSDVANLVTYVRELQRANGIN
ncbi:c-type cytochrome [Pseudothioclava arenosa]|uniref:Cytochrome C n=1 Tax=Pseudothioclava arenosa TaxID=1795308 RepID=A0A2A4CQF6_9RHOB|nr:cytochrome c [Pseudothioclava arenosa]PCD76717.1 cytochrome C [Pseudothioclava arenosa]